MPKQVMHLHINQYTQHTGVVHDSVKTTRNILYNVAAKEFHTTLYGLFIWFNLYKDCSNYSCFKRTKVDFPVKRLIRIRLRCQK